MKPIKSAAGHNYEVGYGKPPKSGRFRKGESGNPKARNRSGENILSIFKRHAMKRVKVNVDGVPKTLLWAEAIILKNYQLSLQQDENAMGNIIKLGELTGEFQERSDPKVVGRPLFMPERLTEEEFMAEFGTSVVKFGGYQTDD